jgi:HEAT repeat protein
MGAKRGIDRMRAACADDDPQLRVWALASIGLLGEDVAAPLLKAAVSDAAGSIGTRAAAALALGLLGSKEEASFLREVVHEEWEPTIRSAAILALGLLRDEGSAHAIGRVLLGVHPLRSPDTSARGEPSSEAGLKACACWALGRILTPKAYDYLVWTLDRGEEKARAAAAIALAAAPGTAGVPALRRAVVEGNPFPVREHALLGLAERGDPSATEEAVRILDSPVEGEGPLAPFAVIALGLTRDAAHAGRLLGVLEDGEREPELRAAAALALGLLGDRKSGKALDAAIAGTKHPFVAGWGAIACALLGTPGAKGYALKIISESELPEPRRDAVTALRILAPADAADVLANELADSYYVNLEAALALARVDAKRAATELTKRLSDPGIFTRRYAARALGVLLDRDPPGPLTELIGQSNLLSGSPVLLISVFMDNEYLFRKLSGL